MTAVRAVLASIAATALLLAGLPAPASAAVALTLSRSFGASGAGGTIVGSVPQSTSVTPFAGITPVVQFQFAPTTTSSTACSEKAKARAQITASGTTTTAGVLTVDPGQVKRITSWKIAFQVPTAGYPDNTVNPNGLVLAGTQTQSRWVVCVYDSESTTSSTLIASASYTIAVKPVITKISPDSSPSAGGQTISVTGSGFTPVTSQITATIGGAPLSNIKVSANGTSFTGTTGTRAPGGGQYLTVVAPGGTVSSEDPNGDGSTGDAIPFTYSNAITVSPNTAASNTVATLSVTGAGFTGITFDTSGTDPTSNLGHVFLVDGAYDASGNREVAECDLGMVISDTELVCDLDLRTGPVPDGAYIVTVVADGSTGAGPSANPSIISSGAGFVVAPY
ncbi:IPT/TIG domain-containing protein [Actinoplanes sp. NPDC023714]|uniref:IPT/TIG domain-containing protein n=1 Tax=Actinoplanes sp. NPDC023714 TaxID=3154322 RepID=UPI0033C75C9A